MNVLNYWRFTRHGETFYAITTVYQETPYYLGDSLTEISEEEYYRGYTLPSDKYTPFANNPSKPAIICGVELSPTEIRWLKSSYWDGGVQYSDYIPEGTFLHTKGVIEIPVETSPVTALGYQILDALGVLDRIVPDRFVVLVKNRRTAHFHNFEDAQEYVRVFQEQGIRNVEIEDLFNSQVVYRVI